MRRSNNLFLTQLLISCAVAGAGVLCGCADKAGDKPDVAYTIAKGDSGTIDKLLQEGLDANARLRGDKVLYRGFDETPLYVAARFCRGDIVRLLIASGADVNGISPYGRTPLHGLFITPSSIRELELMPHYRSPNKTVEGRLPPPCFYEDECLAVVSLLVASGANVNAKEEASGATPLHLAARSCYPAAISRLLECGAEVNPRDVDGSTPLHYAVQTNSEIAVQLLVTRGADVDIRDSKHGWTPLHEAVMFERESAARALLESGARVNTKDLLGHSPLWHANKDRKTDFVDLLRKFGATD